MKADSPKQLKHMHYCWKYVIHVFGRFSFHLKRTKNICICFESAYKMLAGPFFPSKYYIVRSPQCRDILIVKEYGETDTSGRERDGSCVNAYIDEHTCREPRRELASRTGG